MADCVSAACTVVGSAALKPHEAGQLTNHLTTCLPGWEHLTEKEGARTEEHNEALNEVVNGHNNHRSTSPRDSAVASPMHGELSTLEFRTGYNPAVYTPASVPTSPTQKEVGAAALWAAAQVGSTGRPRPDAWVWQTVATVVEQARRRRASSVRAAPAPAPRPPIPARCPASAENDFTCPAGQA